MREGALSSWMFRLCEATSWHVQLDDYSKDLTVGRLHTDIVAVKVYFL